MKTNLKVVSLQVLFNEEAENTYVMVETDDIEKANHIAQQWAEKKIGKKSSEVVINKGIIDVPENDADDEFYGVSDLGTAVLVSETILNKENFRTNRWRGSGQSRAASERHYF